MKTGFCQGREQDGVCRDYKLWINVVCVGVECGLPGMVGYCWGLGLRRLYSQARDKLWKARNDSLKSFV